MRSFHRDDWPAFQKPIDQLIQTQRRTLPRERKRLVGTLKKWQQLTKELNAGTLMVKG